MLTYIKNRLRIWLLDESYIRQIVREELQKQQAVTSPELIKAINEINIS
jgi:uncharacterized membrane protein YbaN (DUF454 family)